jgi:hypothetical protein
MTIDTARLRELAAELGFWPATTDEADIEHQRQHNKNTDYWLARAHGFDHLRREHERRNREAGYLDGNCGRVDDPVSP